MSLGNSDSVTATRRFGLGARPGERADIANDPRNWVLGQLDYYVHNPAPQLLSTADIVTRRNTAGKLAKKLAAQGNLGDEFKSLRRQASPKTFIKPDLAYRFAEADATRTPLIERLVYFWADHFTVSRTKSSARALVGVFEREAIRPNILGSFHDLLFAAATHPAMLFYLDNARSVGPDSDVGQEKKSGINENFARELLELHTLGVNGGYSQGDVTQLALALTGWSVSQDAKGTFTFDEHKHQPGTVRILGREFAQLGMEQGKAILRYLAAHPSTARFISTALATEFVSSPPPPALVDSMSTTFRQTNGNLKAVVRTMLQHDAAWTTPPSKMLPPVDFILAAMRALNINYRRLKVEEILQNLGQTPWGAPSPAGWPKENNAWVSPAQLMARARWAEVMGGLSPISDIPGLAEDVLGQTLTATTRNTIREAESRPQGIALFLLSPEFQRR